MAFVVAVAIGLASSISAPAPASATTTISAMGNTNGPPPSPLTMFITPLTVGMHIVEAIAEGIANAVEAIATPAPIAIPAPHIST